MPKGGARPGAGRKPNKEALAKNHSIKFTDEEWKLVQDKAKGLNLSVSEYIRQRALQE